MDGGSTPRSQRRLTEELEDDGISITADAATAALVVEELDYARRIPMFEGRRPLYGALIGHVSGSLDLGGLGIDLVEIPSGMDDARFYADGRSSYLVRGHGTSAALACFDRPVQYEADLVMVQEAIGALIVQRTPVLAVTRLFQHGEVVSWNGRSWVGRPTATSLLPTLRASAPHVPADVARGLLDITLHWLSPARVGATFVVDASAGSPDPSFDTSSASRPPVLSLADRRHLPPLLSCLMQRDLATLVDLDGTVHAIGVGLRASDEAEHTVSGDRGMRHRSAQRWSLDHPDAVVAVVSDDGPVTVYRSGAPIIAGG